MLKGKKIELSKRLSIIATMLEQAQAETGAIDLIDIGTDHGYIPIYIMQGNSFSHAYACDLRKSALDIARKNILDYGLENKIECIISNGFQEIEPSKNSIVSISGMGSHLIIKILKDSKNKLKNIEELVLSGQGDIDVLRAGINDLGYSIADERFIIENNHDYIIIRAKKGKESLSKLETHFGKLLIKKGDQAYIKFLKEKRVKTLELIAKLKLSNSELASDRIRELHSFVVMIDEVLNKQ